MAAPPPAQFALALLSLDGVGRVTAHRVLERFPTLGALRRTPREQVLLRLKGAPHAERTVETLFSDGAFGPALDRAGAVLAALARKNVHVLAPGSAGWPARLGDLERADRPAALYAYGDAGALARPLLAALASAPIDGGHFEALQDVARRAFGRGAGLVTGAASGVDVALLKLATDAGAPSVAVVGTGLARLAPSLRPAAVALVRAGGALVSPFPMTHGPFEHDDRERALVQAALASAVLVVAPAEGSAEARAASWAAGTERPLALVGAAGGAAWAGGALAVDGPGAVEAAAGLAR
jgi:DNA processing protein